MDFAGKLMVIICMVCVGMLIGLKIGCDQSKQEYQKELKMVGIEKLVKCNNAHSNWVEIVWSSKEGK